MRYFPVFLDLTRKTCMVVGAGKVGLRKINTLIKCSPAGIIVLDPHLTRIDIPDPNGLIRHYPTGFTPGRLQGCDLVFACTGDPGVNRQVADACRERHIWCNLAQNPELGDFILPGVFSRQDLIVAVSTCGCSPALTARIKQDLEARYGPEYASLTELLAGIRTIILTLELPQEENREYFRKLVESDAAALIQSGRRQELETLLLDILPAGTHKQIQRLLDALL